MWSSKVRISQSLLLILFVFIFAGCKHKGTDFVKLTDVPVPNVCVSTIHDVINWQLTTNTTNSDFLKENIDSIILVSLATNDECMIGSVSELFLIGDTLVLCDQSKSKSILKFNLNGDFISKIGSQGEGPGEYGSINGIYILDDSIVVNDWMRSQLISYSIHSNGSSIINMSKKKPQSVVKLNDSILVGAYASYFSNNPFAVEWFDKSGKSLGTARPFEYTRSFPSGVFKRMNDGRLLYYRDDCDTIFEVKKNELISTYTLGFDENFYDFVNETLDLSTEEFYKRLMMEDSSPLNSYKILECGNFLYVNYQKGPYSYMAVVDNNTNTSKCYLRSDLNKKSINIPFVLFSGNDQYLLSYIDEKLKEMVSKEDLQRIYDVYPYIKDIVENYDYDNYNPLICLLKVK